MNFPNKLTLSRFCVIPFFVFFILCDFGMWSMAVALAIYVFATVSDIVDGHYARKHNLVTDFGKLLDPIADKVMVGAALICFIELNWLPAWFVIICITREFIISGFRMVAADKNVVIAASKWGKKKSTYQMTFTISFMALVLMGFDIAWEGLYLGVYGINDVFATVMLIYVNICVWLSLFFTIMSLIDYFYQNREILKEIIASS